jgi:hypothetical protein
MRLLLRRIKLDIHVASNGIRVERPSCARKLAQPLSGKFWLFLHRSHLTCFFNMRPSIPDSQDAKKRLKLVYEVHALVRTVLELHKDEM